MSVEIETDHPQVPFKTRGGWMTYVDEGVYDVLASLREAGVRTQFSCQGDEFGAYFLSDLKSTIPLLFKTITKRGLSAEAKRTRKNFLTGTWELDLVWFVKDNYELFRKKFRIGPPHIQRYALELNVSNVLGVRFIARWPTDHIEEIEQFLVEVIDP